MNPMVHCQLWMGSLEPNMTESFIMAAYRKMGENPTSVKVMRNKYTGEPAGYCFVHFASDEEAVDAMHKLNGKPIPGTTPLIRFRLNNASRESKNNIQNEREYSVWVGDLSSDVDDYSLYRAFSAKYSSIKAAKVILDNTGFSKGYGFVRFGLEDEQKNALYAMNGYSGLGTKPVKICTAVPKPKSALPQTTMPTTPVAAPTYGQAQPDYNAYYDPSTYWQNYSQAWTGYNAAMDTSTDAAMMAQSQAISGSVMGATMENMPIATNGTSAVSGIPDATNADTAQSANDDLMLVEHKKTIDIESLNKQWFEREKSLWDSIESSRWTLSEDLEIS